MKVSKITLLGHKDHGKSTMIGSMLLATNSVTKERLADAKKTSESLGRKFEPGFILDSFVEEREKGLTIDTTRAQIKYKDSAFEFIDVPGHEELIKNMISGASYASFAILMVSAKSGEGIRPQTKRHIFLSKMMGVNKLIVAVNKMDTIKYSEAKFDSIREELSAFLKKIGFEQRNVTFIPVSAYNAENIAKKSPEMCWYKGKTVLDTLNAMASKSAPDHPGPTRMILQGFLEGLDGVISGRIVSGKVTKGQKVFIVPAQKPSTVTKIFVRGKQISSAKSGENAAVMLSPTPSFEPRGCVMCGNSDRIIPTDLIEANVFMAEKISKGMKFRFNGNDFICKSVKVNETIDPTSGASRKGEPKPLEAARMTITLDRKIPAESFSSTMQLGRFVLYKGNGFAGIGTIR